MSVLPVVAVVVLLLAALFVATFKGSRTPLPIPSSPTAPKRAVFAAFVPVACAGISYAALKGFEIYLGVHLAPPGPLVIPMRVGWFAAVIAPWFIGVYFAYIAARAANRVLRAIGALEVLICLLQGSIWLFASTVGFG